MFGHNGNASETMPFFPAPGNKMAEVQSRRGFIIKVYAILSMQLMATMAIGWAVMMLVEEAVKTNALLLMLGLVASTCVTLGIMCVFSCYPQTMRNYPTNYVLLAFFTVAEAFFVGFVCAGYTEESVLLVLAITALAMVSLSCLARCTSVDLTGIGPYLFCALLVLMLFSLILVAAVLIATGSEPGIVAELSPSFEAWRLVLAALGALIFSLYIVYDTQLILGGRKEAYGVDDYVAAALAVYLDLINLFLNLLSIVGERD